MNLERKAFTLLEFLIFILVLSILISAILGSFAVVGLEDFRITQNVDIYNVPICNKVAPNCVFRSPVLESLHFYEINATIP
ncbi:type II secretion system protein [uncultured Helicobacter sp.]|uniref:type II secretion system protein n=1 Tax=uncultured Helicobacter sp. TaxID=175537 RepID=UPI0026018AFF|nr:type II secretion system protein [uncultured Helicobacter sp.]